jgi:hypothetical protein
MLHLFVGCKQILWIGMFILIGSKKNIPHFSTIKDVGWKVPPWFFLTSYLPK